MDLKSLYLEILKTDSDKIRDVERITSGQYAALNTPEKRALFLFGFRNPELSTGCFTNSDTPKEEFIELNFGATDKDAYYVTLGKAMALGKVKQ